MEDSGVNTMVSEVEMGDTMQAIANLTEEEIGVLSFESAEDAGNFYSVYASIHGFSIRKQDSRRRKNGEYSMQKWVCSREGFNRQIRGNSMTSRYRSSGRVGCNAGLRVNMDPSDIWRVTYIHLEHNHELVPTSLSCFLKDRRCMSESDKAAVASMLRVGFRQADVMRLLAHVSGGNARVGFTIKDMNNELGKSRRHGVGLSDIDSAVAYLSSKKRDDSGMALVTHVDNGKTTRLYWADSASRLDYHAFGDVISFDSTFKTNTYGLQMVPICGVNHHHHTVVFGSGLLMRETSEDYRWLLTTHTKVMGGKHPRGVVTDADKAIISAVHDVWGDAKHRLCMWHFNRNITRHVSSAAQRRRLYEMWHSSDEPDVVECLWVKLMSTRGTIDPTWLDYIYSCRHSWWECYLRGNFWAELRSTQRCERMHRFMKGYVKAKHRLHEFLHHYERAIADLRHKELQSDFETTTQVGPLVSMLRCLEEDAGRTYTLHSLRKVQHQLKRESLFFVVQRKEGEVDRVYKVAEYNSNKAPVEVYHTIGTGELTCSCLHFETVGFPCCHAFHIAKIVGMTTIPRNLVLRRWTKKAKGSAVIADGSEPYGISVEDARQGALMAACRAMCHLGSLSVEAYEVVSAEISRTTNELQRVFRNVHEMPYDEMNKWEFQARKKGKRPLFGDVPYEQYGTFAWPPSTQSDRGYVSDSSRYNDGEDSEGLVGEENSCFGQLH